MPEPAPWTEAMNGIDDLRLEFNATIARETTFRVGGQVACLARPRTVTALLTALAAARRLDRPRVVIGGGSNVLMPDGYWDALVIQLKGFPIGAEARMASGGAVQLVLDAGVTLAACQRYCLHRGLFGFEALVGIPGTIGGALMMNAGAHGATIFDHLLWLDLLTREGERRRYPRCELDPGYRTMGLPAGATVLEAGFQLRPGLKTELRARLHQFITQRRATQPLDWPSAGCVFKNPPGASAGMLIERAGLKGLRIGDAAISERHGNWIINRGRATAKDVLSLIELVEQRIENQFGIHLERELVVLRKS